MHQYFRTSIYQLAGQPIVEPQNKATMLIAMDSVDSTVLCRQYQALLLPRIQTSLPAA
jgi:hypothetical protein